MKKAVEKKKM